ncbi:hypothetical protein N5079_02580 [Planotetraspora sp. A-T 1434]|uniref:hypothetical protein n=1 Tax=Planotetraspora sp. A-T 1434 TaxID=2979219 RepID=UPI0021BEDDD2|nr:hypothetical protein [Planotetraspora sp. A-T 1434]MCT9929101.1 hypothetical protein [Planotetraspora sp. A-T 1434]
MTVLLALGLVTAWSVLIPGFMDWDDIVVAVIGSLRLTGPVAAAFAAWVAVRGRRANNGRALTPWRAVKAPLAILVVVSGSFGATVLVLCLRAALGEQPGHLLPSGLAMCVASLALYVVVGWIVGWLVPLLVTPVLAGIGTYGLFTGLANGWTWADRLAPATREPYDVFEGLSADAFSDQTLWLLGLSAALLLGWVALVTRRTLALAAAVIAVLAAGTGGARLVMEPQTLAASERLVYSCQEWPISVCVHPAMRAGLTELAGTFTTIAARLAGTPAAFKRVEQHARGDDAPADPGVVFIHVDDLGVGYAERAAAEFLDRLAKPCPGMISAGYRAIVVAWLRNQPLPGGTLPEHQYAARWFSELTENQRRDWLRMFYSDFASCRLQSRHFGGGARPIDPNMTGYPENPTPAYAPIYPVDPSPAYPATPITVPSPGVSGGIPGQGTGQGVGPGTGLGQAPGQVPGGGLGPCPGAAMGSGPAAGPGFGPGAAFRPGAASGPGRFRRPGAGSGRHSGFGPGAGFGRRAGDGPRGWFGPGPEFRSGAASDPDSGFGRGAASNPGHLHGPGAASGAGFGRGAASGPGHLHGPGAASDPGAGSGPHGPSRPGAKYGPGAGSDPGESCPGAGTGSAGSGTGSGSGASGSGGAGSGAGSGSGSGSGVVPGGSGPGSGPGPGPGPGPGAGGSGPGGAPGGTGPGAGPSPRTELPPDPDGPPPPASGAPVAPDSARAPGLRNRIESADGRPGGFRHPGGSGLRRHSRTDGDR